MTWLVAAPLLIPFAGAAAALLARGRPGAPHAVALIACAAQLAAAAALFEAVWRLGPQAAAFGGWGAPVGIVLAADMLSAVMTLAAAVLGLVVALYAAADVGERGREAGFGGLFLLLLGGATGAFLTADLFNLYVWFEVMLIAAAGLLTLGGGAARLDAGVKYLTLNLIATLAFLSAVGLIYALTGTLAMSEMAARLADAPPAAREAAAMLLFAALAAKAGLFPLFAWLPAAYHTPPTAVTALFAALVTKAGIYALMRVFTVVFPDSMAAELLPAIAIATMVVGVIGAAAQIETTRILAFHIVSQIGYVALGLAIGSALALTGAVLYLLHNMVVKTNLILIAGVARRLGGGEHLDRAGGLYGASPALSALFLVSALAMAGLPPFSGFWGKLALSQAAVAEGDWAALAAILGVGFFTLYSMSKIWLKGYLKPRPQGAARGLTALPLRARVALAGPIAALAALSLAMGFAPEPFLLASERAAASLLDVEAYAAAVRGAVR
jgi:multicomponent Na+:H+ antiporter subunit D